MTPEDPENPHAASAGGIHAPGPQPHALPAPPAPPNGMESDAMNTAGKTSASGDPAQSSHGVALPPHLAEGIRQFADNEGRSMHTVEGMARETVRLWQKGARTTLKHELLKNKEARKEAAKELKIAKRDANRVEPLVHVPDEDRSITVLGWLLLMLFTLGLIAGVFAEQFGAARLLQSIGAFGVESISEALLITSTALAVGAAFISGRAHLYHRGRTRVIKIAALVLVVLFALYAWNFASGVERAELEHRQATDVLLAGESVGDGAELALDSVATGPTAEHGSEVWLSFFCLLGMVPFTMLLGRAGLDLEIKSFQKWVPNARELDSALDLVAQRESELRSLETREAELKSKLAQCDDEENAVIAAARAQFLIECRRRDSRKT